MPSASDNRIVVATAADNNYAIPLAVAVRSLLDTLAADSSIRLMVLDGGLSDTIKQRLVESWRDPRLEIQWEQPDQSKLVNMPVSGHVSAASYYRLQLPTLLPKDEKVLYLDSDIMVRRDVTALWNEPLQDYPVLAAQEFAAPWINAEHCVKEYQSTSRYLAAARPIANYKELGIPGHLPYFNAGIMVINLELWRDEQIAEQMIECLDRHAEHVLWWDQYAANVIMAGRWKRLDPRWNQGSHLYEYPSWEPSPFDKETFECLKRDPWIVHFCSPDKPWHDSYQHPFLGEYFATLDRTAWQGWRPPVDLETRKKLAKARRKRLKNKIRWSLKSFGEQFSPSRYRNRAA